MTWLTYLDILTRWAFIPGMFVVLGYIFWATLQD